MGLSLALWITFTGCTSAPEQAQPVDVENMPRIDFHTHYTYHRDYLNSVLDEWNMQAVVVDVVHGPARERWAAMKAHHAENSDRLILCTSFDASRIDEPDFAENVIASLKQDIADGAKIVKVWKNIGMVFKDQAGQFIQIDDPRFQPIWDYLTEQRIPVLAHIGEPRAAWLPLDPKDPHYDYYANHPQYHAYNLPEIPRWETIIAARDRWLERNPNLVVVGAHMGSMAYDVDEVAKRLDAYPNFYVDTAERFGDLAIQPSDKVRQFFITYQDRIVFGTDLGTGRPVEELSEEELQAEREDLIRRRLEVTWEYVSSSDSLEFVRTGTPFKTQTQGLGLPADVLEKFYYRNAVRILGLETPAQGA